MDALAACATRAAPPLPLAVFSPNRRSWRLHLAVTAKGKENESDLQKDAGNSSLVPFLGNHGSVSPLSKDAAMGLVLSAARGRGWTTGSGMEGPSVPATDAGSDASNHVVSTFPWSLFTKSPRRRMLVAFSCNVCGQRTTRAINPHAYTDGTVFVQCCGCNVFHKLVDNLNLFDGMKCYVNPDFNYKGNNPFDHMEEEGGDIFPIL
ncbi:hypothetical protein Taro_042184 [Colocasia esculenta]|uniref:DNL-type domain-containing protein n=1 Tax=Colocasia esculenta TaxID=4460 RepID=A0A843WS30_COLES|nr:hypothetical protein [Colocasia esculenta]